MFTNEFEFDATVTTILDETAQHEDIEFVIDETEVYIRQWNEMEERNDLIIMSHEMWQELLIAMKKPEGAYRTFFKKNEKS